MAVLKLSLTLFLLITATGCQAGYLIRSAWSQADLLLSREPLEKVLRKSDKPSSTTAYSEDEVRKLQLATEAKTFAEEQLGLKKTKNYTSVVKLDRPYVSYIISAAKKNELEFFKWWFPIVGHVPYKGYFDEAAAVREANMLQEKGLDTYVRGASAYSTLGWFYDPILSSMLRYSDYDLVDLIINETVHATIYIKSAADFNERLATFLGDKGADLFFQEKGPDGAKVLSEMKKNKEDEKVFSEFISREIDQLQKWYANEKQSDSSENDFLEKRSLQFQAIYDRFKNEIADKITNEKYRSSLQDALSPTKMNNARLLSWKLYIYDLSDFEKAFEKLDRRPDKFIAYARSLEKLEDPAEALKEFISDFSGSR